MTEPNQQETFFNVPTIATKAVRPNTTVLGPGSVLFEWAEGPATGCFTYWGSHGCSLVSGHDGHHRCDCCECDDRAETDAKDDDCVGCHPFYGPDTNFY